MDCEKKYNLRKRKKQKECKVSEGSDSSDDSDYYPPSDEEEDEKEFKLRAFQQFVGKLFPSRATEERLENLDKLDQLQEEKEEEEEEEEVQGINIYLTLGEDYEEEFDEDYGGDEEEEEEGEESPFKVGDIVQYKDDRAEIVKEYEDGSYKIQLEKGKKTKVTADEIELVDAEEEIMMEIKELVKAKKKGGSEAMMKKFEEMAKIKDEKDKEKREKREKKEKAQNMRDFRKLLREKRMPSDFSFFKEMTVSKQKSIIKEVQRVYDHMGLEKPYRITLLESDIPVQFKSHALEKINMLAFMDSRMGEYYKTKQWVDTFMTIPFGKYKELPVKMGDEGCNDFMDKARKTLDECVYGLNDAKMQILQVMGQLISNPSAMGTAIAIKGPPGTGKTTLIKEGISKILDRPFAFMALGGATDSSFLEGHSFTYEGAIPGKIVEILRQSKCMNPVIYFDELDKISETPKGEEIVGILTHLTDTTQNGQFHDKYFANVDFDLSKALFIFSYNDEKKVNPVLKDRMYCIETKSYDNADKNVIASKYLIPNIEKNVNFEAGQIVIPKETIEFIIQQYTKAEKGVRNLKRCLEIIYTKLNLFRLMKADSDLFDKKTKSLKVVFPYTVTPDIVRVLIKKTGGADVPQGMYM